MSNIVINAILIATIIVTLACAKKDYGNDKIVYDEQFSKEMCIESGASPGYPGKQMDVESLIDINNACLFYLLAESEIAKSLDFANVYVYPTFFGYGIIVTSQSDSTFSHKNKIALSGWVDEINAAHKANDGLTGKLVIDKLEKRFPKDQITKLLENYASGSRHEAEVNGRGQSEE